MKTVGFLKSDKENENRICLLPDDILNIKNKKFIFIEKGYGEKNGFSDDEYKEKGINVVSKKEVFQKDIIIDPKIGDAKYLSKLNNKTIFGWIHAVQNRSITDTLINNKLTAYAWEDMFEKGKHVFWRNNEIAGESAVIHAFMIHGVMPYDSKVAILGNGNIARGAYRILSNLGASLTVYNKKSEEKFKEDLENYDVIINAILWDVTRKDHIIYKSDLKRLKKNALIIDISCDRNGAIETSIPTTIENPTYRTNGILHYVVDHTPSLFYKTVSYELSKEVSRFVDLLIEEKPNECLLNAKIIENGKILDFKIKDFQHRTNE